MSTAVATVPNSQSVVGASLGLWNTQGVTFKRNVLDQQVNPGAITGAVVQIQTNKLSTSGFLRAIELDIPPVAGTLTIGTGTFTYTANQFPAARILRALQLSVANVNNLINVNGIGLAILKYLRAGNTNSDGLSMANPMGVYALSTSVAGANYPFVYPAQQGASLVTGPGSIFNFGDKFLYNTSTTSINLAYRHKVWLTEMIRVPNTIMAQFGNATIMGEQPYEFGLLPLQNTAQNVAPAISLSSIYALDLSSPIQVTGNAVASYTPQVNVNTEYYDVPPKNAPITAFPTPYQQQFAVTRIQSSVPVAGGAVSYIFASAGFLFRSTYIFYNETSVVGTLVDAATLPNAIKTLKSANIVQRSYETFQQNLGKQFENYGTPSPGIIVDDYLVETGTNVDFIDTGLFTQYTAAFTGLTNVTRMEVIEERLIPIGLG